MAQSGLQTPIRPPARPGPAQARWARLLAGAANGNGLLTSVTGAVLIVLLAALGITILRIGSLLWEHLFIGLLALGPIALKLASTGYRFVRYYTRDEAYLQHGPPVPALRLLAPLVVLSTLVVFVTGLILLLGGPSTRATWLPIHKDAFFVWLAVTAVHVLGHLPQVGLGLRADYGPAIERLENGAPGRSGRALALAGALVLGAVLAVLLIPDFAAWTHAQPLFHHHR